MTRAYIDIDCNEIWPKVTRLSETDCWLWSGQHSPEGKAIFCRKRDNHQVARLVAFFLGLDITGRNISNTCGNRGCVNPRHYCYRKGGAPLVPPLPEVYNQPLRSSSSLSTESDPFLGVLLPLRSQMPVILTMSEPAPPRRKQTREPKPKVIAIHPMQAFGASEQTFLVSIIGGGSCLVNPRELRLSVANLVLAKMPAKLANTLMEKLHRVLQE